MSDRITEIKASELTLEHLFLSVEMTGHEQSVKGESAYVGQLIGLVRTDPNMIALLGPGQNPVRVIVPSDSTVKLLDAPTPDRAPMNFGAAA